MNFKLILKADQIPLGSTVSKITGEKKYTISDVVNIFQENKPSIIIKAENGGRFLMPSDGYICAVNADKELLWETDYDTLQTFLANTVGES